MCTSLWPSGQSLMHLADTNLSVWLPLLSWLFLCSVAQPCSLISNPKIHAVLKQTRSLYSVHGSHTYSESCHLYFEKKEVKEAFQRVTHSNPLRQTAKFCPSKQNMYCSSEALSKTLWLLNPCVLSQMFYRLATEGHLDFFSMILNASKQKEMGSHTIWLLYITLSNKI